MNKIHDLRFRNTTAKVEQVNIYKLACIATFAAVIITVVILSFMRSSDSKIVFKSVINQSQEVKTSIINPTLHGTDNKNQPFSIMAKKATEVSKGSVELEHLNAELFAQNGKWFSALAPIGIMHTTDSTLILKGIVQIFTGDSEELTTDKLSLNLKNGTIVSHTPVTLISNNANLSAKSMTVSSSGKKITFNGKVKMKIYNTD